MARTLGDLVQDRLAVWLLLRGDVHFRVKEALGLEVRDQVLTAFLNDLLIDAYFLIYRQKFVLGPAPDMRSLQLHVNERPALYVECDVRMVVAGVVIGGDQLHLGVEVILLHQRIL